MSARRSSASFESLGWVTVLVRAHSGMMKCFMGLTGARTSGGGLAKEAWDSDAERNISLEGDDLMRVNEVLVDVENGTLGSQSDRAVRR
jgi:hypothetical protein